MSQTETLMFIALGFALALVLVLLFGHTVWNIAMRLGARRQAKQIPTAMLELQADRDRLRADHAMMSRKLELRLEDIKTRMTEQMAEVSRHRNRVQSMVQDLEKRDETLKIRDREVAALNAQLEVQKADLASCYDAIEKLTSDSGNKEEQLQKQAGFINQLSTTLREKNALVGNLGNELQSALRVNPAAQRSADPTENRLMQRVAELTAISTQISNERDGSQQFTTGGSLSVDATSRQASLNQQLADTEKESVAMAEQLKALDELMKPHAPLPAAELPKKSGAMANVISLAQRIRALQKSVDD
jgi:predicted RNase H-like nuclease (RuvC/YqgF family)